MLSAGRTAGGSALLAACAALGARLQSGALSTAAASSQAPKAAAASASASAPTAESAPKQKSVGRADPDDAFIFKAHCKGKRVPSEDAKKMSEILRKSDFGSLKKGKASAAELAAATQRSMHSRTAAAGEAGPSDAETSADDVSQELVEEGSKRMMQSDEGREDLRQGTFDLDHTTERVLQEGKAEASPGAAARADDKEVKDSVKNRVVSMSQTS